MKLVIFCKCDYLQYSTKLSKYLVRHEKENVISSIITSPTSRLACTADTNLVENVQGHGVVHVVNDDSEHRALGGGHCALAHGGAAEGRVCCLHGCHSLENSLGTLKCKDRLRKHTQRFTYILLHAALLAHYFQIIISHWDQCLTSQDRQCDLLPKEH